MCMDGPDAPVRDEREFQALLRQMDLSERAYGYFEESDRWNRERLAKLDAEQSEVTADFRRAQQKADQRADEAYDYYMDNGRPMIDRVLQDANNYDSEGTLAQLRAKASADVEQAFNAQRTSAMQAMGRMGVNPSSGRFASTLAAGGAKAALAKVHTANTMTEQRKAQGAQMRQQAGNLVSGMPAQSLAFSGQGTASGGATISGGNSGMQNALGLQGAFAQGMGTTGNMMGSVTQGWANINNRNLQQWQAEQQASSSSMGGLGSLIGTLGYASIMASDRRLKRDIVRIGQTPGGIPTYRFKYIWSDEEVVGVMADEVEAVIPEAVVVLPNGYKMVNYDLVR